MEGFQRNPNIPIQLLSFDIDFTLLDEHHTNTFYQAWHSLPIEKRPILSYNSGRSLESIRDLVERNILPQPDLLIGSVGTAIVRFPDKHVEAFYAHLDSHSWSAQTVYEIIDELPFLHELELQPPRDLSKYKISYYVSNFSNEKVQFMREKLAEKNIKGKVIYSSEKYLDILPEPADKGKTIFWVASALGIHPTEIVVGGDSGNDVGKKKNERKQKKKNQVKQQQQGNQTTKKKKKEERKHSSSFFFLIFFFSKAMFTTPGLIGKVKGILVGNSKKELTEAVPPGENIYHAKGHVADGIIEGLKHFQVFF